MVQASHSHPRQPTRLPSSKQQLSQQAGERLSCKDRSVDRGHNSQEWGRGWPKGQKRNDTWHELPCHPYPPQNTTFLCLLGCFVSLALASFYNTLSLLVTVSFSISLDIRSHFLIWGAKGSERFWSFLTGKVRKGCISGLVRSDLILEALYFILPGP